jgi:hypothetical protein
MNRFSEFIFDDSLAEEEEDDDDFKNALMQESTRKDMKRAFGVLQKCFGIILGLLEYWKPKVLWQIMTCCINLAQHDH